MNFLVHLSCKFWKALGKTKFAKWGYRVSRNNLLKSRLVEHNGRQKFKIGYISKTKKKSQLIKHLKKLGFEKDPYAWKDEKEILSMRKIDKDLFQYHVRLHKDGEIRGHYEYAPDRRPLKHLLCHFWRSRKKDFKKMLREFLK